MLAGTRCGCRRCAFHRNGVRSMARDRCTGALIRFDQVCVHLIIGHFEKRAEILD
jgi:hypothetical protein